MRCRRSVYGLDEMKMAPERLKGLTKEYFNGKKNIEVSLIPRGFIPGGQPDFLWRGRLSSFLL